MTEKEGKKKKEKYRWSLNLLFSFFPPFLYPDANARTVR